MSQSRTRKPQCIGGETISKGRPSTVPCAPQSQPKKNNRDKNKLPKSIRYDLENALVGLCDVWFEDIKPHLVRNKIKLHVDTNGASPSGDFGPLPPGAPGCSHLDPGAASDRRQQVPANSVGCCTTRRTASKAQSLKPPASNPPPPPRPPLTPNGFENKNSKSKSPRRTRSRKKPQPPAPSTSIWRVPCLCRTCSQLPSQPSPRICVRRVKTASPIRHPTEDNYLLSIVPRKKTTIRNKYTQTDIPYKTKSSAKDRNSIKRMNTEPITFNINTAGPTNPYVTKMDAQSAQTTQFARCTILKKRLNTESYYIIRNPSLGPHDTEYINEMPCEAPEAMGVEPASLETQNRNQNPPKRSKVELISSKATPRSLQRRRSRENRSNTNSAHQKLRTHRRKKIDLSIAPLPRHIEEKESHSSLEPLQDSLVTQFNSHQFKRCCATTNLIPSKIKKQEYLKNQKKTETEPSMLFKKELIDIIGSQNDKRLKLLYNNSEQEEYPSMMNLVPSPGDRRKDANSSMKTRPWR